MAEVMEEATSRRFISGWCKCRALPKHGNSHGSCWPAIRYWPFFTRYFSSLNKVCWSQSVDVQFFGASCIHHKISKFWWVSEDFDSSAIFLVSTNTMTFYSGRHEVPEDQVEQLKTRLLEQIVEHATGPRMITTRLCVAVSLLDP